MNEWKLIEENINWTCGEIEMAYGGISEIELSDKVRYSLTSSADYYSMGNSHQIFGHAEEKCICLRYWTRESKTFIPGETYSQDGEKSRIHGDSYARLPSY